MIVGICQIRLRLPGVRSLKEKRSVLKPLVLRLRQRYNVSVAEVGEQDKWQVAKLAVACVSTDGNCAHRLLEQVLEFIFNDGNVEVVESSLQLV
jgi:uncharacterized protein YlxP (DUF503 family)